MGDSFALQALGCEPYYEDVHTIGIHTGPMSDGSWGIMMRCSLCQNEAEFKGQDGQEAAKEDFAEDCSIEEGCPLRRWKRSGKTRRG